MQKNPWTFILRFLAVVSSLSVNLATSVDTLGVDISPPLLYTPNLRGPDTKETTMAATTNRQFPSVIELSTRPWLYELSQKYGEEVTLATVPREEWQTFKDFGYDAVWLMGMWELGPIGLEHDKTNPNLLSGYKQVLPSFTMDDVIGSPYAVVRYSVNPDIGTDDDLRAVKQLLSDMDMELVLDLVPNHTAIDCPWTTENPDYYVLAPSDCGPDECVSRGDNKLYFGGDFYNHGWTDTAQLNYWNPETRAAVIQELLHIASFADIIRCDMAHDILNAEIEKAWGPKIPSKYPRPDTEFWGDAIAAVKAKYPHVRFLAEAYTYNFTPQPEDIVLQSLGFDFTYDKTLLDKIAEDHLDNLRGYIQGMGVDFFGRTAHFVENHDDNRAAGRVLGSTRRSMAGVAITATMPGLRLFFQGESDGYHNQLDVHLRRSEPEASHPDVVDFHRKLLNITKDEVFHTGQWEMLSVGNSDVAWRLIAWKWNLGDERRLVVVNFSDQGGNGAVVLSDAPGEGSIPVVELISGSTYQRSADEMRSSGLFVVLDPFSAQVFGY